MINDFDAAEGKCKCQNFTPNDFDRNLTPGKLLRDKQGQAIFDDEGNAYVVPENFDFQVALDWGASLRDRPIHEKLFAIKNAFQTEGGFLDAQRSRDGKPGGRTGPSVPAFQAAASYIYAAVASAAGLNPSIIMAGGGAQNVRNSVSQHLQYWSWLRPRPPNIKVGPSEDFFNNPENVAPLKHGMTDFATGQVVPNNFKGDTSRTNFHGNSSSDRRKAQNFGDNLNYAASENSESSLTASLNRQSAQMEEQIRNRRSEIEAEMRKPRVENRYWRDPALQDEYRDLLARAEGPPSPLAPRPDATARKAEIEIAMREGPLGRYWRRGSFMPEEYRAILEREAGAIDTGSRGV